MRTWFKAIFKGHAIQYGLFLTIMPLGWVMATHLGFLKGIEGILLNTFYAIRGECEAPIKLIYVDLDSKAIELMGERPFPRIFYAEVIQSLFMHGGAKAIGVDIVFSDAAHSFLTDPQKIALDNQAFRKVIQQNKNLILAAAYTPKVNILTNEETLTEFPFIYKGFTKPDNNALPEQPSISLIGVQGGLLGIINVDESMPLTTTTNWVPLFAYTPGPTYYTMALQLFRIANDLPLEAIRIDKNHITIENLDGSILRKIPMTYQQLLEVNWFSKFFSKNNPRYSMADILTATAWLQTGSVEEQKRAFDLFTKFQDAVVLIGPIDPMLQDLSPTPFDKEPTPRVGIHGNLLKTIAAQAYVIRWHIQSQALIVYVMSILVFLLTIYAGKYSGGCKTMGVCLMIGYIGIALLLFKEKNMIIPVVGPIGSAISVSFLALIYKLLQEEKQKSRIKNLFGTYVSPDLVSQMVESQEEPKLGGMEEHITAFFSDIQNFSSFSEKLPPGKLVELMNEYLSAMTDILQADNGTLDKYIGDAIVAMFGAPVRMQDHALRACMTACNIQRKQIELSKKWKAEGNKWPDLVLNMHTRIGLNTGPATVGNMGSSTRFNYTMMGDTVNLAARAESGAKAYGVYTMVTAMTKDAASYNNDLLLFRFLDKIIVKGRSQPVDIYELIGLKKEVSSQALECVDIFEKGISFYMQKEFKKALSCFEKTKIIEPLQPSEMNHIETNPSIVFIERCLLMIKNPPIDNWDGVFMMKSK